MKASHLGSALLAVSLVSLVAAQSGSLTIESWRNDDLSIWQDTLIPAFNEQYPDIEVTFTPSAPAEYNAALNAKLEAGSAGDLITTGTISGVAAVQPNPFDFYLKPGDEIEAEITGIGTLRNRVISWEERYGEPAPQRVDW